LIRNNDSRQMFGRVLMMVSLCLVFAASCTIIPNRAEGNNIQPSPAMQKMRMAQLIIKFRNNVPEPSKIAFVQELSRDAQATLFYVRPMSGGAHVFRVDNISSAAQLAEVIQRLAKRPDVLYVEQDKIMQHQQK